MTCSFIRHGVLNTRIYLLFIFIILYYIIQRDCKTPVVVQSSHVDCLQCPLFKLKAVCFATLDDFILKIFFFVLKMPLFLPVGVNELKVQFTKKIKNSAPSTMK